MERKTVSGIMVALLLTTLLMLTFNTQQVTGSEPPPTQWIKMYGGPNDDNAYSVVQTSDGGYALAGQTEIFSAGDSNHDFWLVKTDSVGTMQWNQTYGGVSSDDVARSLVQTSDGGYALAGSWLVKTDSSGNKQWDSPYGGSSLVQTNDGGYALAGGNFQLVKIDSSGIMRWSQTYGGPNTDYAQSLVQTSDGGYAMAGTGKGDAWLVKVGPELPSPPPGVPEFPLGLPLEILFIPVIVYILWKSKRRNARSCVKAE